MRFARQTDLEIEEMTTVMIRNIPCRYNQDWLISDIREVTEDFNFVYLPPSKRGEGCLGYAFVNFTTPESAQFFIQVFHTRPFTHQRNSTKCAEVVYAVLQGFEENVRFYKKSKVRKTEHRPYVNRSISSHSNNA
jgi:RNA recognition motif-containing protein